MTGKEVDEFVKPYKDNYGWQLVARSGDGDRTDDSYKYHFVDDLNMCIIINPNNKGFSFSKSVDFLFRLVSDEFSPLDYPNHFERNYLRFRKIVLEKGLE